MAFMNDDSRGQQVVRWVLLVHSRGVVAQGATDLALERGRVAELPHIQPEQVGQVGVCAKGRNLLGARQK